LIPVTARWTDAKIRKGPLSPYARDAETKTMTLLEQALVPTGGRSVNNTILQQLQASSPRDVAELLPHLQARGEEFAREAQGKLTTRGEAEAKAMKEILETQKRHIADTIAKHDKKTTRDSSSLPAFPTTSFASLR
jgi:hypothetical protein